MGVDTLSTLTKMEIIYYEISIVFSHQSQAGSRVRRGLLTNDYEGYLDRNVNPNTDYNLPTPIRMPFISTTPRNSIAPQSQRESRWIEPPSALSRMS